MKSILAAFATILVSASVSWAGGSHDSTHQTVMEKPEHDEHKAKHSEEFTKGKVKKVNAENGKVSVVHEELKNLGMPAMTMVFRTSTPEILAQMKPGKEIEFVAERVDGKLTITKIKN